MIGRKEEGLLQYSFFAFDFTFVTCSFSFNVSFFVIQEGTTALKNDRHAEAGAVGTGPDAHVSHLTLPCSCLIWEKKTKDGNDAS